MDKRTYTVIVKEKNSSSTTKSHIQASNDQEVKRIVESRGGKVIEIYFGKIRIFGKIIFMALSSMKKMAQDSTASEMLKARAAKDTTKPYNREEFIQRINDITAGRIKPSKTEILKKTPGKKTYSVIERSGDTTKVTKAEFEKRIKQ
jgi:hypothetical protein